MNVLALIFALVVAAVVQALLPATRWTGYAPVPVMASVVVYYALLRPRAMLLAAAVGAGLVEDSLGQMPLGYTSFCYAVAALVVEHFRETVIVRQWTTHVMFGALVSLGVTAFTFALLAKDGLIAPGLGHALLRLAGAFLLGGVAAPLAFAGMETLDRTLGNIELGESG